MAPRNTTQPRAQRGTPKGGEWESPRRGEPVTQLSPAVAEIPDEVKVTIGPDMPMSVRDYYGREIPVAMGDLYVADFCISSTPPLGYLSDGRSIQMRKGGLTTTQLDALGKKRKRLAKLLPVASGGTSASIPQRTQSGGEPDLQELSKALANAGGPDHQVLSGALETLRSGDALLDVHVDGIEALGADMAESPDTATDGRRLALFARMVRSSSIAADSDRGVTRAEARAVRSHIRPDGSVSKPRPIIPWGSASVKIGKRVWSVLKPDGDAIYAAHGAKLVTIRKAPDVDYGALWKLSGEMVD